MCVGNSVFCAIADSVSWQSHEWNCCKSWWLPFSFTACNDTAASMDKWLSRLESSNWMSHIRDTLNCACLVAQCLDQVGCDCHKYLLLSKSFISVQNVRETMWQLTRLCMKLYFLISFNPLLKYECTLTCK